MKKIALLFRKNLILQLSFFSALIWVFWTTAFFITNKYADHVIRRNTLEHNETILNQASENIATFFDTVFRVASSLSYTPTTLDFLEQDSLGQINSIQDLSVLFSNTALLEEDIVSIYLYNKDLDRIASMGEIYNPFGLDNRLRTRQEIGAGFFPSHKSGLYYPIYYPIYDLDSPVYSKQIGMYVFIMKSEKLQDLLHDIQITENTQICLLDNQNQVLAFQGNTPLQERSCEVLENSSDFYVQTQKLADNDWMLVSRLPEADLAPRNSFMNSLITAVYLISFLFLAILVYYFYRKTVRPIYSIDNFVQNTYRFPDRRLQTNRQDEIGTVITSLNNMLDMKEQMTQKLQDSQKKMYETKLAEKQAQILAYRNQLNPHFLYNTFECICDMAMEHDDEDIAEITLALSDVFRYVSKGKELVTIEEEIHHIQEYSKIIDYRFLGKISIDTEVDPTILKKKMPKMLLQPLVENAVFHGLEKTLGGGLVDVTVTVSEINHICFCVEDNGVGIEAAQLEDLRKKLRNHEDTGGIGIANIYRRLFLLYGDGVRFEIDSQINLGTKVTIIIPDNITEVNR